MDIILKEICDKYANDNDFSGVCLVKNGDIYTTVNDLDVFIKAL